MTTGRNLHPHWRRCAFLAPGWFWVAPSLWLPITAVLPVTSSERDDPRSRPDNMVATEIDDFTLRDADGAARLLVDRTGRRLTVVGSTLPETVCAGLAGRQLDAVVAGLPFATPPGCMVVAAAPGEPLDRARAPTLVLRLEPPLWAECPFAEREDEQEEEEGHGR